MNEIIAEDFELSFERVQKYLREQRKEDEIVRKRRNKLIPKNVRLPEIARIGRFGMRTYFYPNDIVRLWDVGFRRNDYDNGEQILKSLGFDCKDRWIVQKYGDRIANWFFGNGLKHLEISEQNAQNPQAMPIDENNAYDDYNFIAYAMNPLLTDEQRESAFNLIEAFRECPNRDALDSQIFQHLNEFINPTITSSEMDMMAKAVRSTHLYSYNKLKSFTYEATIANMKYLSEGQKQGLHKLIARGISEESLKRYIDPDFSEKRLNVIDMYLREVEEDKLKCVDKLPLEKMEYLCERVIESHYVNDMKNSEGLVLKGVDSGYAITPDILKQVAHPNWSVAKMGAYLDAYLDKSMTENTRREYINKMNIYYSYADRGLDNKSLGAVKLGLDNGLTDKQIFVYMDESKHYTPQQRDILRVAFQSGVDNISVGKYMAYTKMDAQSMIVMKDAINDGIDDEGMGYLLDQKLTHNVPSRVLNSAREAIKNGANVEDLERIKTKKLDNDQLYVIYSNADKLPIKTILKFANPDIPAETLKQIYKNEIEKLPEPLKDTDGKRVKKPVREAIKDKNNILTAQEYKEIGKKRVQKAIGSHEQGIA